MRILVIQGSPDERSFCHSNALNYMEVAKRMGYDVTFVDLSKDKFEPVLRYGYRKHMGNEAYPEQMQELINKADHLTFFFPVWWSAEPSILKGWLERTLTPGFAYKYTSKHIQKLLKGKTASVFITAHAPTFFYGLYGGVITRWKHMILGFCGIRLTQKQIMGKMESKIDTNERRVEFMRKCSDTLNRL